MKTPKYKIGDKVWLMSNNECQEKVIYGILPKIKIGRRLPQGVIWDDQFNDENLKIWNEIPDENKQVSTEIADFYYILVKRPIDVVYLIDITDEKKLPAYHHWIPESKLFSTKKALVSSL